MDRTLARQINKDTQDALKAVAEKHNLNIEIRGCSFSDTETKPKVIFSVKSVGGVDLKQAEFEKNASLVGMKKEHFGASFRSNGKTYSIIELSLRRRTRPVIAKDMSTGKRFVFNAEDVVRYLSAEGK